MANFGSYFLHAALPLALSTSVERTDAFIIPFEDLIEDASADYGVQAQEMKAHLETIAHSTMTSSQQKDAIYAYLLDVYDSLEPDQFTPVEERNLRYLEAPDREREERYDMLEPLDREFKEYFRGRIDPYCFEAKDFVFFYRLRDLFDLKQAETLREEAWELWEPEVDPSWDDLPPYVPPPEPERDALGRIKHYRLL